MEDIKIVEYEEKYYDDLKRLSYEWLEKYLSIEPEDEKFLNDPKKNVLDQGGKIFISIYGGKAVGTISLIKVDDFTFELAKLAVTEKYQGLKIGRTLIAKSIEAAKQNNAAKIILYTNHILASALALYQKFGFKEVALTNNKYAGADIKMELEPHKHPMSEAKSFICGS